MATDTYALEYIGKIEKLQAELAKIPGATEKSAFQAAQRMAAQFDRGSKQAAKKVEANLGDAFVAKMRSRFAAAGTASGQAIESTLGASLKHLAQGTGFGELAERIGHLGGGFGAAGVAAGAAALGIGAAAKAMYSAADAAGYLKSAQAASDAQWRQTTQNVGSFASGPAVAAQNAYTGLGYVVDASTTGLRFLGNEVVAVAGAWSHPGGLTGALEDGMVATVKTTMAINAQAEALAKQEEIQRKIAAYQHQGPRQPNSQERFAWEAQQQQKAAAAAEQRRAKAEAAARAASAAAEEQARALVQWDDDVARMNADRTNSIAYAREQEMAASQAQHDQDMAFWIEEADAYDELVRRMREANQQRIDDAQQVRNANVQAAANMVGAIEGVTAALAANEHVSKKTQKALFYVNRAAAIAQIGIQTAQAIVQTLATTPGPAGFAQAVAVGAIGATQLASVLATPAPKFHQGAAAPDEGVAVLQRGEAVLTPRGNRDRDREQGVRDLNRGAGRGTGGGVARVMFEGRDVDVVLARTARQHGQFRRELDGRRQTTGAY